MLQQTPRVDIVLRNGLSPDIQETLDALSRVATERGVFIALKGGLGTELLVRAISASRYHGVTPILRPLTADVDWTCERDQEKQHIEALGVVTGREVIATENIESSGLLRHGSRIVRGSFTASTGALVELDLIPLCRVSPAHSGFFYEFGAIFVDREDPIQKAVAETFNGLGLNAPEVTLCEKLALARGADLGKFDLTDAALILAFHRPHLPTVREIVTSQKIRQGFDDAELSDLDKQIGLCHQLLSSLQRTSDESVRSAFPKHSRISDISISELHRHREELSNMIRQLREELAEALTR